MIQKTLFDAPAKLSRKSDPITSQKSAAETEPKLGKLQIACLDILEMTPTPMTANEIGWAASRVHSGSPESYRKRIHELLNSGSIEECGERRCEITGKLCRTFKLKER
jgi:hypothetical protein